MNNGVAQKGTRRLVRWLVIVTALAMFAGEAWAQRDGVREDGGYLQSSQAGPNARIEVLGSTWRPLGPVSGDHSRILVYRPVAGSLSGATSVFVNGQYHTSLVKAGGPAIPWSTIAAAARQPQSLPATSPIGE